MKRVIEEEYLFYAQGWGTAVRVGRWSWMQLAFHISEAEAIIYVIWHSNVIREVNCMDLAEMVSR